MGVAVTCFPLFRRPQLTVDTSIVALCKRKFDPGSNFWSLPGGKVKIGETIISGAAREFLEECGLEVNCLPLQPSIPAFCATEAIYPHFHYALAHVLALAPIHSEKGELPPLRAGDDADDVCWVRCCKELEKSPYSRLALPFLSDLPLVGPVESVVAQAKIIAEGVYHGQSDSY